MVIFYVLWNYAGMGIQPANSGIGSRLDAMLSRVKPAHLSERGWLLEAKVNTSFFTDLRNKGTVPSIDKVERLARVAGLSLAEFVAGRDDGYGVSAEQIRQAIRDAFPLPPKPFDQQAEYLADIVLDILALPPTRPSIRPNGGTGAADERAKGAPPRRPTKKP